MSERGPFGYQFGHHRCQSKMRSSIVVGSGGDYANPAWLTGDAAAESIPPLGMVGLLVGA